MNAPRVRVAVVDDDEGIRRSFVRLIRAAGMDATAFPSAEAFLEARDIVFDCVLLDVRLEGMSAEELAKRIAAFPYRPALIYMSGDDRATARQQGLADGAVGYFNKADAGVDVVRAIREGIGQRR